MNPTLLLHGALGEKAQLDPLLSLLDKRGRKVFSLNFSGHGGEPFSSSGFGIETFADDIVRFLDAHRLASVDIFGYSMGGYVALWLAHQSPQRVGQIVTLGTKFDWSVESAAREVRKLDPEKILEKVPAFARVLERRHAPSNWKELLHKTASMMTSLGERPLLTEPILASITNKTWICLGDADDMADRTYSEQVAGMLPNGKFTLLENTGHPIEKVNLAILEDVLIQP